MLSGVAAFVGAVAVLGCAESHNAAIGTAVAGALDTVNGSPTVVLDAFWCDYRVEVCIPGTGGPALSPVPATDIATAFAEGVGIPVRQAVGFRGLSCPWTDGATQSGLYAQFVRPPLIEGDTARVELTSGCAENGAAFEQTHEFVLRREGARWVVLRRTLTSIT
jgi:hypothetical protein